MKQLRLRSMREMILLTLFEQDALIRLISAICSSYFLYMCSCVEYQVCLLPFLLNQLLNQSVFIRAS